MEGLTCGHCGFTKVPFHASFCPDCGVARPKESLKQCKDGLALPPRRTLDVSDMMPLKRVKPSPVSTATCPACLQPNIAFGLMDEHQRRHCAMRKEVALRTFHCIPGALLRDGEAGEVGVQIKGVLPQPHHSTLPDSLFGVHSSHGKVDVANHDAAQEQQHDLPMVCNSQPILAHQQLDYYREDLLPAEVQALLAEVSSVTDGLKVFYV
eukprot:GGOE01002866.1.p1 GENE.GGOE01002866.1~~GGOE01002866.1.p1  ORF type:complete len:226 (-),score=33.54 GGOE01002866.1:336-962(-)